jgi:hypothetical protein
VEVSYCPRYLLKKGSCADSLQNYMSLCDKGRIYVCRSSFLHFNSPDLNSEHFRLSAQAFFSLVSLCSCIRIEKKIDFKNRFLTLLNHGKAYAIKKAIISYPEPVFQFLVLSKSLESSFGTNHHRV